MKKYIILFLIVLSLTACKKETKNEITIPKINDEITEQYIDDNPIKIGIYYNNNLVKTFTESPAYHKVLGTFNIYYTNQNTVDNNGVKYNFNKYYNQYKDIDKYKIGFYITYKAEGKKVEETIIDASKTHVMDPYLYVYLYDDIHQKDGTWYSHVEEKDMKENTIFSSIKLFYANKPELIEFPITLTAFTYKSEEDFNKNKQYRGNSFYTIEINDK